MSITDIFQELGDIEDIAAASEIKIISGAYVAAIDQFLNDISFTMRAFVAGGIRQTLDELLPQVAKLTGAMRQEIHSMFLSQILGYDGIGNISLGFDRALLDLPKYLKYHDIEWELNPKFNPAGYKFPTTPGTRPFSEQEFMAVLFRNLVSQLIIEWTKFGFSFTIKTMS